MKIVYVTGCLGFIGSHVTRRCLAEGFRVIGVDKITYAADVRWLREFEQHANFKFIHSDINDLERLHDCDYVINIAAETHVDNSIADSDQFLHTNVNGVHHLLSLLRRKRWFRVPILLHFSTDEVYGDIAHGSHVETDVLKPSNPYAATKAAADMLIMAWSRTYGLPYVLVRPTNNYGIGQYVEKLIPKSVKHLVMNRPIDIHDRGEPIRNWLYVEDTADAVIRIMQQGVTNEIFNISGNCELPNREVVKKILSRFFGRPVDEDWTLYITEGQRVGQDVRYSIDDSKLRSLGWQATTDFDTALAKVFDWYKQNFIW